MKRPATWKVLTVGAAMTGLGLIGAGPAAAAPSEMLGTSAVCTTKGPLTTHCQTSGSNQIHTAPNPNIGLKYGPFYNSRAMWGLR